MTPTHHVPEELLAAYATGAAPEAMALFVAVHASLCPPCRARIAEEEALAGALMARADGAPRPDLLAKVLGRLDEPPPPEAPPLPPDMPADPIFPRPLARYLGPKPAWKRVVPGLEVVELPLRLDGQPATVTRLAPGTVVPPHTHTGWELQLVLGGGYTGDDGRFARGDAHCADERVTHGFRVDDDAPCVSLLVRQNRIVSKTLRGRFFAWLTGA